MCPSTPPGFSVSKRSDNRRRQILLWTNADWRDTRGALRRRDDVILPDWGYNAGGSIPIEFIYSGIPKSQFWRTGTIQVSRASDEELEELMEALRRVLVPPAGEALILKEVRRFPSPGEINDIYEEYKSGRLALRLRYPLTANLPEEDAQELMKLQLINDLTEANLDLWISIKRMIRTNFNLENTMGAIRSFRKLTELQLLVFNTMESYENAEEGDLGGRQALQGAQDAG